MKFTKTITLSLLAGMLAFAVSGTALADLNDIKDSFGTILFNLNTSAKTLTKVGGTGTLDMSAYIGSPAYVGSESFRTFCVESSEAAASAVYGRLSLSGGISTNTTPVRALSNGAAWLYMKYVTGQFGNLNTTEMSNLQTAITTLMSGSTSGWSTTNTYLQYLLANSGLSQSQAIAAYQVGDQSVTAGYAVFVVQLNTSASFTTSGNRQDFLYIARYSPDVPEPATILLWSLGSVGAFGFGWMKKRRKMMTAMA